MAGVPDVTAETKSDHSLLALIAANVVALLIAYATGMDLRDLMMVYWIQSVIIGIAALVRLLCLNRFDPEGRHLAPPDQKREMAFIFSVSYGFFHGFYFWFLAYSFGMLTHKFEPDLEFSAGHLLCGLVFATNHGYALLLNVRRDVFGQDINNVVVMAYPRIIPMHLAILFGGWFYDDAGAFALFAALKVAADALMHVVEQRVLDKGRVPSQRA